MHTIQDLPDLVIATVTDLQREASRVSSPVIRRAMADAYELCAAEQGPGSFGRMKSAMVRHVEGARDTMFQQATTTVKESLEAMRGIVTAQLSETTREILASVFRDYKAEWVGAGAGADGQGGMSPRELELRASVRNVLRDADGVFALLLRGDGLAGGASEEEPAEPAQGLVQETPRDSLADAQQPFDISAEAWHRGLDDHRGERSSFPDHRSHVAPGSPWRVSHNTFDESPPLYALPSSIKPEPED